MNSFIDTQGRDHTLELNAHELIRIEDRFGLNLLAGELPVEDIPLCLNLIGFLIAPDEPEESQAARLASPEVAESSIVALTSAIVQTSSQEAQRIYSESGF